MAFKGTIIVTGATGFLGSRLTEKLIETPGIRVIAAGRTIKPHAHIEHERVEYRLGDLSEGDYVDSLFSEADTKAIVNCAALSSPWGTYQEFHRANVLSQEHLIRAAERTNCPRFVFISSPTLYYPKGDMRDRIGIKESEPLPKKFVNHYAATKRLAEIRLEESNLDYITLRPRALLGRGDTVIMPRLIRAYEEGRLKIIGTGKNKVDLTPVSNVVDAILYALTANEEALGKVYNISNGEPIAMWPAVSNILQALGYEPPTQKVPYWLVDKVAAVMETWARISGGKEPTLTRYSVAAIAKSYSLDISLARKYLGYEPQQSIEEAMAEFVTWYQSLQHA